MTNTLEHKGYSGSVEFSSEDHVFHGSLVGIKDKITFEGESVRELEDNFRGAIDEYLAFCEAEGKVPDKPFKGSFNVRIGHDLHKRLALRAKADHLTLNKALSEAVERYLVEA